MNEYPNIIPNIEDWPINQYYKDRSRVVKKLTQETLDHFKSLDPVELTQVLNQTVYSEKLRVKSNPLKVDPPNEAVYWRKLESEMSDAIAMNGDGQEIFENVLHKICRRYAEEITGNFHPKTFLFLRKLLTLFFKLVYNPFYRKRGGAFWGSTDSLLDKFKIIGPLDHIRNLFDKGTVVVLPTHFSNLDSIAIGYAIEMLTGLPAFSYGAGLNLYDYELMAYYMSRAGAYKVDRRKKNPIYSQATKQYSTISIQEGLNGIFFPGGTRSRSGQLEKDLKLGLLSTLVDAQNEFYLRNFDRKIIIVPLVMSYHFVFEAESLIDQHLRRTGKENYLTTKKQKDTSFKSLRMLRRFFRSDSSITLSFGHPIDIFGHQLNERAESVKGGRKINIKEYFQTNGQLTMDLQRNRVYTRHLADKLVKSYHKENVVLSSHLVTFLAFELFRHNHPSLDIFSLLNLPRDFFELKVERMLSAIGSLQEVLIEMEDSNTLHLSEIIRNESPQKILQDALINVNVYHSNQPLVMDKQLILSKNLKVLYYYSNRLRGYGLEGIVKSMTKQKKNVAHSTI